MTYSQPKLPHRHMVAANDDAPDGGESTISIACDFSDRIDPVEGEADLLARFIGDIMAAASNDNEQDEGAG